MHSWISSSGPDETSPVRAMQRLAGPELAGFLADYDPHAEAALRVPAVDALRARLGPGPLTEAQRIVLEARPGHDAAVDRRVRRVCCAA